MLKNKFILLLFISAIVVSLFLINSLNKWSKKWEKKFEIFQPSEKIMEIIGIKEGMIVGEIGAGNGRFAVRVARKIGDKGKIFANDIDIKAVRFMKERCERENVKNMIVILSHPINPYFPKDSLDLVYIINAYEYISDPVRLLKNTKHSLKENGKLAIIAHDAKKSKNKFKLTVNVNQLIDQLHEAGFQLIFLDTTSLKYDNIYIFVPQKNNITNKN